MFARAKDSKTGYTVVSSKSGLKGLLIGDKGFISPKLKANLANQGLETPLKKNMKDTRNKNFVKKLKF